MARPKGTQEERVTNDWERCNLLDNLTAMQDALWGQPLHNIRRKHALNPSDLATDYPVLNRALYALPAWSALFSYTRGEIPTCKQVDKIALFCTKAFAFDRTITREDLLHTDLSPFPPLREEQERWHRYVGIYRGFYLYTDAQKGSELHGALLQLQENTDGDLLCRWVTGIRRDERFSELEDLLTRHPEEDAYDVFHLYSKNLPPYESRMVFYEGMMDPSVPQYFLLKLLRRGHSNSALVLMRRWDFSVQPHYTGGVALVNLFQDLSKASASSHPMLLSREKLTLTQEKELLLRHLRSACQPEPGMILSMDMDRKWNHDLMEWSRCRERTAEPL